MIDTISPGKSQCGVERIKRTAGVVVNCPGETSKGKGSEGGLRITWEERLTIVVGDDNHRDKLHYPARALKAL